MEDSMKKTNQKLVPEYGATYGPRFAQGGVVTDFTAGAVTTPRSTVVRPSGSVMVRGKYQSQPTGRVEVFVSIDPVALERKVALRWAQNGVEQSTSDPALDSLFGTLR